MSNWNQTRVLQTVTYSQLKRLCGTREKENIFFPYKYFFLPSDLAPPLQEYVKLLLSETSILKKQPLRSENFTHHQIFFKLPPFPIIKHIVCVFFLKVNNHKIHLNLNPTSSKLTDNDKKPKYWQNKWTPSNKHTKKMHGVHHTLNSSKNQPYASNSQLPPAFNKSLALIS